MKKINTLSRKIAGVVLMLLLFAGMSQKVYASHMVGSDITYKCLDALGNYKVTLVYYRDCSGIPTCSGNCSAIGSCTKSVEVRGADPTCNGVLFFSFTVSGVSVRDVNPNPRCANAKSNCTDMGCVTAGSLTPGIERYEFQGTVNIGPGSGIPANCCNVVFGFQECCRNGIIQNISPGNFWTEATVNRCAAAYPDCNSPDLTNDPYAVLCAGQGFIFNNGAFDPDLDSLVYTLTASLDGYGVSATYIAPFSYNLPLPYTTPTSGNYPYGFHVDPLSGDIMFKPNVYPFNGVLALRMEQWRLINGVYVVVGVTRRDLQMHIKYCDPNTPPSLITNPPGSPPQKPKTRYEVCAGDMICFDVIAKDTDFLPPLISDTTYLSWNNVMAQFGATFTPNYDPTKRQLAGPREDTYKFCWTPNDQHCKRGQPTSYPFTIKAVDSRCPYPGIITQGFSVRVLPRAIGDIKPVPHQCGKFAYKYVPDPTILPAQTFQSYSWSVAKQPNDWTFSQGSTNYGGVMTTPIMYFPKGGKYLVEFVVNMLGPSTGGFCSKVFRDTLIVDTNVAPIVRDTFSCKNSSVSLTASGKYGSPPYTYRWFNNIKDTLVPLNGPLFQSPNYSVSPTNTRNYTLQIRDFAGCRNWDSITVQVKQLPVGLLADSMRICYTDTFTVDPGNNGGNIRSFLWNTGDTTQTIDRRDSNTFVVLMTDTFGCANFDTLRLKVNARIKADAGLDTFICQKDTITLWASGGRFYSWKNLANNTVIAAKTYTPWVKVNPTNLLQPTNYMVTVYQSYPDTTNRILECQATDTVAISVKPLPSLSRPAFPMQVCSGTKTYVLGLFTTNLPGGTGAWSYPKAPGAILNPITGPGVITQPTVKIDSLKNLPNTDTTLSYPNWIKYSYTEPTFGCKNSDSANMTVYGLRSTNAGANILVCENGGRYQINVDSNLVARGVWPRTSTSTPINEYYWTGAGVDSTTVPSKKYYFDPTKPGVLVKNIINYRFLQVYNRGLINEIKCLNSDTTMFTVTKVPVIDAGSAINICKTEPQFNLAAKANATVVPVTGASYWTGSPTNLPPNNIVNGIVNNKTEFNPGLVSPAANQVIYYKDSSTGCLVQDSTTITIVGFPLVSVSYDPAGNESSKQVCANTGDYVLYTKINGTYKKSADPGSYLGSMTWSSLATGVDGSPVPNASFNSNVTPGNYNMIFKVTQSNSFITCTNFDTAFAEVQQPPAMTVTPGGAICDYTADIPISVNVQPASYSVLWSASNNGTFGDSTLASTTFAPSSASRASGGEWVIATTVLSNQCATIKDSTFITVDKKPNAGFNCPDCDGCESLTSHLNALSSGVSGASFKWQWDDGFSSTDSAYVRTIDTYGTNGVHPFKLIVTGPGSTQCANEVTGTMVVHAVPVAAFSYDPPYTTVAKPFYNFTDESKLADNSARTYVWDMGPFEGADPATRTYTIGNPKNVQFAEGPSLVKMKITSEFGCWDTTSREVRVEPDITVFTPNAFYPNSSVPCQDGNEACNKEFHISASGYATVEIFVFNRWGQQVFYTNNADMGWNGKINNKGADCPQDVYIYQVNATSFNGKLYKYSGSITLLR